MHSALGNQEALTLALRRSRCHQVDTRVSKDETIELDNPLEHAVAVGGFLRNLLRHVPVLDNLAALELENIDDGAAAAAFLAHAVDMQDDIIAVGKGALDLA